jgi:hypothetical protein
MFSRIAQSSFFALLMSLAILTSTYTALGQQAQSGKTSIIIDRQLVRFVAPGEAVEWRLEVANQQGEIIFDSSFITSPALEWPLSNQQGEAVSSGLYTYTLSIKESASETPRLQRGHIIVDRPSLAERVWVTSEQSTSLGATSAAVKLTVVGGELAVGGAEFPGASPQREASAARSATPQRANLETAAEQVSAPAVVNGTVNRVAKFAADGTSLIDSAISEVGGNVGIGTTAPQAGFDYRGSTAAFYTRDIGTTNLGTAQSALQLGVSNLGARNAGVGPSMLFFGENSAGTKSFLGRVSGVWENPTAGAEAGALFFQTRANSGDVSALTERMRITAAGNVGIGTTTPNKLLHLRGLGSNGLGFGDLLVTGTGTVGAGITLESTGSGGRKYSWLSTASSADAGSGKLAVFDVTAGAYRMVIDSTGNVGIGATSPQAKLDVRGDVKLGSSGQYFAPGGEENLRIIRGIVNCQSTPSILAGAGFSVIRPTQGFCDIKFDTPFGGTPSITATAYYNPSNNEPEKFVILGGVGPGNAQIFVARRSDGDFTDGIFHFIAIGPR